MNKENVIKKIVLFSGIIGMAVLLSAFGCKQEEAPAEEEETPPPINANSGSYITNEPFVDIENVGIDENTEVTNDNTENGENTEANENLSPANTEANDDAANDDTDANANTNENGDANDDTTNTNSDTNAEVTIQDTAEKLAEIYGTYTNRDNYKNLKDLESYVAASMWQYLRSMMAVPQDPNAPFYGVTSKALSSAVIKEGEGVMTILVTTKREEISSQTSTPKISYKLLLMEFIKEGEEWKLSSSYWQTN